MSTSVWVVRHGQRRDTVDPEFESYADRIHDPDLTELGRWQAWRVGRRFAENGVTFDAVYASPFLRTVQTADEICRELSRTVRLEPGLGEHRNPEWFDSDPETASYDDLVDWFDTVRLDHDPVVIPEFPEHHEEAERRAGEAARRLVETTRMDGSDTGNVLLVGHGMTVGGVASGLVGSTEGVEAPLCGITRIDRDGDGWGLAFSGDTDHLSE